MSTQILDPTPTTDWFAEPLAAIRSLFATQLSDGAEHPDSATTLPPPTSEWRDWAPPTAGETVDTSHALPEHSPVAGTGAPRAAD